jgi:hypothetical protein
MALLESRTTNVGGCLYVTILEHSFFMPLVAIGGATRVEQRRSFIR